MLGFGKNPNQLDMFVFVKCSSWTSEVRNSMTLGHEQENLKYRFMIVYLQRKCHKTGGVRKDEMSIHE